MNKKIPYLSALVITIAAVGSGLFLIDSNNSVQNTSASTDDTLPFVMPSDVTLKSSPKKVYGHYFTPFPIRVAGGGINSPSRDYYEYNFLNPNGEGGKHLSYGGLLRDKPLYYGTGTPEEIEASRTIYEGGNYKDVTVYEFNDMKEEIRRAVHAGLDGFIIDILSVNDTKNSQGTYTNHNFRRMIALMYATQWYNQQPAQIASNHATDFKIMLMPDGTSKAVENPAILASTIDELNTRFKDILVHEDGRLVIAPFYPERKGASYWESWLADLENNYNIPVFFVAAFINQTTTVRAEFKSISDGFSVINTSRSKDSLINNANAAKSDGKLWMQTHAYQDVRPKDKKYRESNNSKILRGSWEAANTHADWVQLMTWNDYSENTQFTASRSFGHNMLDLTAYYTARYKTGSYPALAKDNIYLIHRLHDTSQNPNGSISGYYDYMKPWDSRVVPSDKIEILTFAKENSVLKVNAGGNQYSFNVPAGEYSTLVPLAQGTISATLQRSSSTIASITSPWQVNNNFSIQDLNYYISSAYREGTINNVQINQPDLVVNNISWSPVSPQVGDKIIFSAEIENIGQASTPDGIKHGISFWINGVQVSWSDDSIASLAPGEKRILTANGGKDGDNNWAPTDGGSYSLEAIVDDVDRITESNESNQTLNTSISIDELSLIKGDINNDGIVDIIDLSELLSAWGSNNARTDVNNDGLVDINDLSIVLSDWTT